MGTSCCSVKPGTKSTVDFVADMVVGWVHPSVGLGWVGSEIFMVKMGWLGWVQLPQFIYFLLL